MKDLARLLRRIAVTAVGTVILVVGVILLAAPGPGLMVSAVALAVFAIRMGQAAPGRRPSTRAFGGAPSGRQPRRTFCAVLFGAGAIGLARC